MTKVLFVFFLVTIAQSTNAGGKECTKNVQCGIPAADLEQSREVTDSLSGQCVYEKSLLIMCRKGKCSCYDGFGCSNCGARMVMDGNGEYTTIRTYYICFLYDLD